MLPLKKVSFKKWSEGRHANSRNSQATISQGALTDGLENQPTDIAENPTDIPLIVNDDLVGILNINRPGKKLDYDELTMMKTFAAFGSAAFNNVKTMEQLRQAQKMEAVGQLAGGVAHDFNNKLAGIMGFAELAIHDIDNNKNAGENLRNIIERCEKSAHLVQQLLAFSRQQVLKFQTLNLNEVIRKTIELLNKIIGENIDLTLDLQPDIQLIKADMVAIDQVTMNLCINARDAMAGSGELKIATKNTILSNQFCKNYNNVKPGPYVQLTISDTGSGIPDLVKERIFDPFFTTKSVGEGTGLGLSMVYGLVNQHNGLITCDSQSDIGTTFKIYFPVDNATEVLTDKSEIYIMTGGNECILIVEDDFTLLGIIKTTLESLGYSTITANEGCEGLELFYKNQDSIDLIVTDVIMPCQGGLELYDQVINVEENMKFIFITGYRLKADMIKFTESSNVKLLRKPFRTDDLAKKIRFLLDVN